MISGHSLFRREREHPGVATPAGDVVDDRGAGLDRGARHLGFRCVDRNMSRDGRRDFSDHREDSFHLFVRRNRLRARAGRFAADIDDRGAAARHFDAVFNRRFGREKFAAIGKGIRRHVEDAHEQRAIGQVDDVSVDFPARCVHHCSDYHSRRFIRPGPVAAPEPSRAAAH